MSGVSRCSRHLCSRNLVTAGDSDASEFYVQIMADALTMWEELGKIDNTKVCLVLCSDLQISVMAAAVKIMLL